MRQVAMQVCYAVCAWIVFIAWNHTFGFCESRYLLAKRFCLSIVLQGRCPKPVRAQGVARDIAPRKSPFSPLQLSQTSLRTLAASGKNRRVGEPARRCESKERNGAEWGAHEAQAFCAYIIMLVSNLNAYMPRAWPFACQPADEC